MGRRRSAARSVVLAALVVGLGLVGCSSGSNSDKAAPPTVYVAVGASETVGVGALRPATEGWPEVFRRRALPDDARFVNLGISGATVATALEKELPEAVRLAPTLVTVWLNVNDLIEQVPLSDYEEQLTRLVHALRRDGATRVLLANTPPLDRLPAYLACRPDPPAGSTCELPGVIPGPALVRLGVAAYNRIIAGVAAAEGAEVVDLHAAGLAARAARTEASLVGADGFHPSTAGHRAVAEAFEAALARG